ncbi:hypothetical protein D3C81_1558390 [compost metagenome]
MQQLQRIRRLAHPFFFRYRQYFVLKAGFTQVVQALPGHGAVLDTLFFRHQPQNGVHQRRFSRRRTTLYQHRQRLIELAAHRCQITGQQIGGFTHHTTGCQIVYHPFSQLRRA